MAFVLANLACSRGAAPTRTPANSAAAVEFASSKPVPGEPAAPSTCDSAEVCRGQCSGGAANACTRLGDLVYATARDQAMELWLSSCRQRDPRACTRLMETLSGQPALAEAYGEHACAHGDGQACEFLGMARFLRGRAPNRGEAGKQLLAQASAALAHACELERWRGCAWGAVTHYHRKTKQSPGRIEELGKRAFALARVACEGSGESGDNPAEDSAAPDADACAYLAFEFERSGQASEAKAYWARGCRAMLIESAPEERAELMETPVCERAQELGVAPPDVRHPNPATTLPAPREVANSLLHEHRIFGQTTIIPSDRVRLAIKRKAKGRSFSRLRASMKMCLSSLGLVSSLSPRRTSGSPEYDRQLFETMREWRYRPYVIEGKPEPVCTTVTFIYNQRN